MEVVNPEAARPHPRLPFPPPAGLIFPSRGMAHAHGPIIICNPAPRPAWGISMGGPAAHTHIVACVGTCLWPVHIYWMGYGQEEDVVVSRSCGMRPAFGRSMSRSSSFGIFGGSSRRAYDISLSLTFRNNIMPPPWRSTRARDKGSLSGPKIILFKATSSHVDSCESRSKDA